MRERERDSGEGRAHYSGEEQFQKAAGAPGNFERRAEHPQRDHVPEPVPEAAMDETVGDDLPDFEGREYGTRGHQAKVRIRPTNHGARPERAQKQEHRRIDPQQPHHGLAKGREAQRHFTTTAAYQKGLLTRREGSSRARGPEPRRGSGALHYQPPGRRKSRYLLRASGWRGWRRQPAGNAPNPGRWWRATAPHRRWRPARRPSATWNRFPAWKCRSGRGPAAQGRMRARPGSRH